MIEGPERTMESQKPPSNPQLPEIAFYYPGPVWHSGDWIKNLILFFDGIGLLVPTYMKERPEQVDPAIAEALKSSGLLHILEPETLMDQESTKQLATAMTNIIDSGALVEVAKEKTAFHELSYSRLGGYGDPQLADAIIEQLKGRGSSEDHSW